MAQYTSDESVLEKIDGRSRRNSASTDRMISRITTRRASQRFRSNSISAGICCGSGVLGASSTKTRTAHASVPCPSWSATSSSMTSNVTASATAPQLEAW
jgi:hypothetical protein